MIEHCQRNQVTRDGVYAVARARASDRSMIPPFEIFQSEEDGNVLWRRTAASLDDAKSRVLELGVETPGEFIVMSRRTGNKLLLKCDGVSAHEQSGASQPS